MTDRMHVQVIKDCFLKLSLNFVEVLSNTPESIRPIIMEQMFIILCAIQNAKRQKHRFHESGNKVNKVPTGRLM